MKKRKHPSMSALLTAFCLLLLAPAWAEESTGNTFSSSKPYVGQPPTELIGTWTGMWDNPSRTTVELTIDKVTQEVSGKYKHSATSRGPAGDFNFNAALEEKQGKPCFTIGSMPFTLNNGRLRGVWRENTVELKKRQ